MADLKIMERLETSNDLDKKVPDLLLCEVGVSFLVIVDQHEKVTAISILHDQAKTVSRVFKEGLLVANDVWMVDRGQNTHLIQSILLLFGREFAHFDFFHCVDGPIGLTFDAVHLAKGTLA